MLGRSLQRRQVVRKVSETRSSAWCVPTRWAAYWWSSRAISRKRARNSACAIETVANGLTEALRTELDISLSPSDVVPYVAAVTAHEGFTATFASELRTPGVRIPITADPDLFARAIQIGEEVLWLHTYGERFADDSRLVGNVRFAPGDDRQPLALTAVPGLPAAVSYDPVREVLVVGDGEFGPVPPAVWSYSIGGRQVVKSWLDYRKANPAGKRSSPLDDINASTWEPQWTTDLVDLLTVLRRLVDLAPEQADLLGQIVAGPMLTKAGLAAAGTRWPTQATDRKVRFGLNPQTDTLL